MAKREDLLAQVKFVIANMLNEEQDNHSKLIGDLRRNLDGTTEFSEAIKVLTKLYLAKKDILDRVYKKVQDLE